MVPIKILALLIFFTPGVAGVLKLKRLEDVANLTKLINVQRLRRLVRTLTDTAPRPVGSPQNEEVAVNFFLDELKRIEEIASKKSHFFSVEVQKARGSFTLLKLQGVSAFTNVYEDIQNIIVRIGPHKRSHKNNSLLINCHYDTDPHSLGASDSSANCVIMLETLRVLAHRHSALEGFVVFLFNGASKTGLQGAHAFITQHRRAIDVKAFIDLQSIGAGGQQLLYQAGPDHAWQVTAYSTAAHYPFGSIIAQEIFYSGLVPTETDYRVLRDFGHIPGIGLAYIKNGYVHDTVYDTADLLSDDDLEYSAETLLNIVSYILRSPYLMHPLDLRNGKVVYFDMFGLFIVAYSQDRAFVINESIAILVLLELLFKIKKTGRQDSSKSKELTKRVVIAACSLVLCWAVTIGLNASLGAIMGASGYGLTWYREPYWIIGLYICPAIAFLIGIKCFISWRWRKKFTTDSFWDIECVFFDATRLTWSIMLLALTRATVKSAFLVTSWLLFPTLLRSLPAHLCIKKSVKHFSTKMFCIYLISLVIPMAMTLYMARIIFVIIIPVLGRAGSSINSDLVLAVICAIMVILCLAYLTTLIHVALQHLWKTIPVFIAFFFLTIIIMISSNLSFPYTVDQSYPVPQRYVIQHIHRNDSRNINSGYWIIPLDFNGPKNLFGDVPKLKDAKSISGDCDTTLFCTVPMYLPDFSMYKNTYFLNTTNEDDPSSDIIDVNRPVTSCNRDAITPYISRFTFYIEGPDHMSAQLLLKRDIILVRWSIDAFIPEPPQIIDTSTAYFIFFSRGGTVSQNSRGQNFFLWSFWIEVNHFDDNITGMVDLAVSRHFLHGRYSHTLKFSKFLATFPNWTHITSWTSTYEKYSAHNFCE